MKDSSCGLELAEALQLAGPCSIGQQQKNRRFRAMVRCMAMGKGDLSSSLTAHICVDDEHERCDTLSNKPKYYYYYNSFSLRPKLFLSDCVLLVLYTMLSLTINLVRSSASSIADILAELDAII